jgi:hypothetical protein
MAKRPKVKISPHAKQRFEERTNEEKDVFLSLSRLAHRKGLMWSQIDILYPDYSKTKLGLEVKNYMTGLYGRKKKYYKGYMFVFSSATRKLITMFPCKDKYHDELDKLWKDVYQKNKIFKKISKR